MLEWIDVHGILVFILFFLYSNLVGALPSSDDVKSANPGISPFRLLVYAQAKKFLDLTAANAARAIPQLRAMSRENNKV